ncbi:ABC transporter permease [Phaeobacter inhibens]|uniref:ABC transporter permease n=1 Tax=Phaeobacter inhibens TaxID=221822 RepID=UPI0021A3AC2E|nr:ABC transporter permease [Phaeobacter inhibens]UWR75309.1 ABC transporter permease [Phaeobacter inhibens]
MMVRARGAWRLGVFLSLLFILTASLGPVLYTADPNAQNLLAALSPPAAEYPLGTDQLGRDVLARVLHGARYSAGIAVAVIALSLVTGCALAGVAMWFGGAIAAALTLFSDAVYALPGLLVIILLADVLGGGAAVIIFLLWLVKWPEYFRLSYAVGNQLMNSDHVLASRLAGASGWRIFRFQVLPVMTSYLLSLGAVSVGQIVLSIATIGFLGVGIAPPQAEWGMMINDLRIYWQISPVQLAAPVAAIVWVVLALLIVSQSMTAPKPRSSDA